MLVKFREAWAVFAGGEERVLPPVMLIWVSSRAHSAAPVWGIAPEMRRKEV